MNNTDKKLEEIYSRTVKKIEQLFEEYEKMTKIQVSK